MKKIGAKEINLDDWPIFLSQAQDYLIKIKQYLSRTREQLTTLGVLKYLMIFSGVCLLLIPILFSVSSNSVFPPTLPSPPSELTTIFETKDFQRFILFARIVFLLFATLWFIYDAGKIQLSAQAISYRRSVLLILSMIIAIKVFDIKISEILGDISNQASKSLEVNPAAIKQQSESIDTYVFGILGFFGIYSFIGYLFTFISDYLRSRLDWKKGDYALGRIMVFIVGMYRSIFDVILPIAAFVFIISNCWQQTEIFINKTANKLFCDRAVQANIPEISHQKILESLNDLEKSCPKCSYAITDIKNTVDMVDISKFEFNWKAMQCEPNGSNQNEN